MADAPRAEGFEWEFAATEPVEGLDWKNTYVGMVDSVMNGTKTVEDWQNQLVSDSDKIRAAIIK